MLTTGTQCRRKTYPHQGSSPALMFPASIFEAPRTLYFFLLQEPAQHVLYRPFQEMKNSARADHPACWPWWAVPWGRNTILLGWAFLMRDSPPLWRPSPSFGTR